MSPSTSRRSTPFAIPALTVVIATMCFLSPAVVASSHPEPDVSVADVAAFQSWFTAGYTRNGRKPAPVELRADPVMRFGVFATADIQQRDVYLSIPLELIIGVGTMEAASEIGPFLRDVFDVKTPLARSISSVDRVQHMLALFLIHQQFVAREKSFFFPYLKLLPTEHVTPAFFDPDVLTTFLNGTLMKAKATALKGEMYRDFRWLQNALRAATTSSSSSSTKSTTYRVDDLFPAWAFNERNFNWAKGILMTRMIWWDGEPHLVPMLDMINCQQGPAPFERNVHQTVRQGLFAETKAPWSFRRGEQIFENYGQPNPTYFLYHGFSIEPNVHDCAQMEFRDVAKDVVARLRGIRGSGQGNQVGSIEQCVSADNYQNALETARLIVNGGDREAKGRNAKKTERLALRRLANELLRHSEAMNVTPVREPKTPAELAANVFRVRQRRVIEATLRAMRARRDAARPPPPSAAKEEL